MSEPGDEPLSTWSAMAYPLACLLVLGEAPPLEAAVFSVWMILLGIGTWIFHMDWSRESAKLDHAGMQAVLGSIATAAAGGDALWMLVGGAGAAVALGYLLEARTIPTMAIWTWVAIVAGATGGAGWMLAAALILLGLGFASWQFDGDAAHAMWHLLTAPGLAMLFLAVA